MAQRTRILIASAILIVLAGAIAVGETLRFASGRLGAEGELTAAAGSVPIRLDGRLVGSFAPADLDRLRTVSFTDAEENTPQDGWLLRDVVLIYLDPDELAPRSVVTVSSSSRDKSVRLEWGDVAEIQNYVMFDLSNRGTLKLVSKLPQLDTRDEWVQDADAIEVSSP